MSKIKNKGKMYKNTKMSNLKYMKTFYIPSRLKTISNILKMKSILKL